MAVIDKTGAAALIKDFRAALVADPDLYLDRSTAFRRSQEYAKARPVGAHDAHVEKALDHAQAPADRRRQDTQDFAERMDAIDRGERYTPDHQDTKHDQHVVEFESFSDPFKDLPQVKEVSTMADITKPRARATEAIDIDKVNRAMGVAAQRMQERAAKAEPAADIAKPQTPGAGDLDIDKVNRAMGIAAQRMERVSVEKMQASLDRVESILAQEIEQERAAWDEGDWEAYHESGEAYFDEDLDTWAKGGEETPDIRGTLTYASPQVMRAAIARTTFDLRTNGPGHLSPYNPVAYIRGRDMDSVTSGADMKALYQEAIARMGKEKQGGIREARTTDEMFTAIVNPDRARALGIRPDAPPPPSPERAGGLREARTTDEIFTAMVNPDHARALGIRPDTPKGAGSSGGTKDAPPPKKLRARIDDYGL